MKSDELRKEFLEFFNAISEAERSRNQAVRDRMLDILHALDQLSQNELLKAERLIQNKSKEKFSIKKLFFKNRDL